MLNGLGAPRREEGLVCSEAEGSTRKGTDVGGGKAYLSVSDTINLEAAAIKKCVSRRWPLGIPVTGLTWAPAEQMD